MPAINFQRSYYLDEEYDDVKERATQVLEKYLVYPDLISFNDVDKSITFSTERLIPTSFTNRPRIMLLFSNPHPYSIHQGMFLSPKREGGRTIFGL